MINQTVVIPNSTPKDIYRVLLNSTEHTEFTGDVADIAPKVGGSFSIFGGYATGKILKLVSDQYIEETWRASNWSEGHFSTITFSLKDVEDGTEIAFTQQNLPEDTDKEFEAGWDDFYWKPLTEYFS